MGEKVFALTRSPLRFQSLESEGIEPILGDVVHGLEESRLPNVDTVLFSVGYDRRSSHTIEEVYRGGVANIIEAYGDRRTLPHFVYTSSTGVYAQNSGEWVDESSATEPRRAGGKACLAAERLLQHSVFASSHTILRLAGLYGPGRVPRRADIVDGLPIRVPPDSLINLVHIDDAVEAVIVSSQTPHGQGTFVIADGQPVMRRDYYGLFATLVGAPDPTFIQPADGAHVTQRSSASKRMSNRKMIEKLKVSLRYPDYRSGLKSIVEQEGL